MTRRLNFPGEAAPKRQLPGVVEDGVFPSNHLLTWRPETVCHISGVCAAPSKFPNADIGADSATRFCGDLIRNRNIHRSWDLWLS
jgi:hypothetical protein